MLSRGGVAKRCRHCDEVSPGPRGGDTPRLRSICPHQYLGLVYLKIKNFFKILRHILMVHV